MNGNQARAIDHNRYILKRRIKAKEIIDTYKRVLDARSEWEKTYLFSGTRTFDEERRALNEWKRHSTTDCAGTLARYSNTFSTTTPDRW